MNVLDPDETTTNKVDALHRWLHTEGIDLTEMDAFVSAYCEKLRALDIPVDRFFCGTAILHPQVAARTWKWEFPLTITEGQFTRIESSSRQKMELAKGDVAPPIMQLMHGAKVVRILATADDAIIPSDCQWMKDENYSELYGLPSPNTKGGKLEGGFTWSTKTPGGFTEEHRDFLNASLLSLSTVVRLHIMNLTSKTLLMTYLGADAGRRVHGGEIERGDGLTIRSVIWFSDIRGFTSMSGTLNRHELLDVINGVFEITDEVVRKHKGQVLKYMGDGCMACFSSATTSFQRESFSEDQKLELDDNHGAELCNRAMLAAAELQARLAALKQEREAKGLHGASVGVGLHYGDVAYGNVGAPTRLDFTVIGPSVNLASRVESLCFKLQADVLATEDFVNLSGCKVTWKHRGEHQVKGVSDLVSVYELNHALINSRKEKIIQHDDTNKTR